MEYVTLNNGVKMPILGYGVYQTPPADTESCVSSAIKLGYRSIDTAQAYGNEEGVGNAIAGCGLPREELFITTKIWITNAGYEKAKASIDASLKKLRSDYIDLLLIHQPFGDYYGSYRAMEEAYKDGKVRAIGFSNFYPDRFLDIAHFAEVKPAINQMETHVFQQQKQLRNSLAIHALCHGVPLPRAGTISSPLPSWCLSAQRIIKQPHRQHSASLCKAALLSFPSPFTRSA